MTIHYESSVFVLSSSRCPGAQGLSTHTQHHTTLVGLRKVVTSQWPCMLTDHVGNQSLTRRADATAGRPPTCDSSVSEQCKHSTWAMFCRAQLLPLGTVRTVWWIPHYKHKLWFTYTLEAPAEFIKYVCWPGQKFSHGAPFNLGSRTRKANVMTDWNRFSKRRFWVNCYSVYHTDSKMDNLIRDSS